MPLSMKPKTLTKTAWMYEEPKGITVCQQPANGTNAVTVTIPWRTIRAALDHYEDSRMKRHTTR